jgi:hypothetical protein
VLCVCDFTFLAFWYTEAGLDVPKFINVSYLYISWWKFVGNIVMCLRWNGMFTKSHVNASCYLWKKMGENKLGVKLTKRFYFKTTMFNMLKTKLQLYQWIGYLLTKKNEIINLTRIKVNLITVQSYYFTY